MRQQHKDVLFRVAQEFLCWIGVREPNELSDKWIGVAGYGPKGLDCKAKTADNPAFRFAGLVVDPTLCPEAFTRDTRAAAVETWNTRFLKHGRVPAGFICARTGAERGLVKRNGRAIHADFDLMTIGKSSENGEHLFTTNDEEDQLFDLVKPALDRGFGVPLVQHGSEFMYREGVGAREMEYVLWFGPGRRFKRQPSSMPKGGH
jgi:hypothetical protein